MSRTTLRNQKTIKVLRDDVACDPRVRRIASDQATSLPQGYVVMPMVVLKKPEPIRDKRKGRR